MADSRLDLIIKARDEASAILKKIQGELGGIDKQSATASRGLDGMRDSLASIGAISSVAFVGITAGLKTTIDAYSQAQSSQIGFEATAKKLKIPLDQINAAAQKLSADGLIPLSTAQAGLQNLMQAGMTDVEKMTNLMTNFKDEAAFGKSASIDLATAVLNNSEAFKTESSSLGNLSGITENYSQILERGSKAMGKRVVDLTDAERADAKYIGLMQIGAVSAGNSALSLQSLAGAQAMATTAFYKAQIAIGEALEPAFRTLLNAVTPIIQKVTEWVEKNPELVAQLAGLALGVTGFGVAMGALSVLMTPAVLAFGKFLLIATAVAGAAALIKEAYDTNFMGLKDTIDSVVSTVKKLGDELQKIWDAIAKSTKETTDYIEKRWAEVEPAIRPHLDKIENAFTPLFDKINNHAQGGMNQMTEFLGAQLQNMGDLFVMTFKNVASAAKAFFALLTGDAKTFNVTMGEVWENISSTIQRVFGRMWEQTKQIASKGLSAVGNIIRSALDGILQMFGTSFEEAKNVVFGKITELANGINERFNGVPAQMYQMGINIIDGLIRGITAKAGEAVAAVGKVAGDMMAMIGIKTDSHSPSRVAAQYGEWVMEGLSIGIKTASGDTLNAMETAMDKLLGALEDAKEEYTSSSIEIGETLKKLGEDHGGTMEKLSGDIQKVVSEIKTLKSEYSEFGTSQANSFGTELVRQEQKVAELQSELQKTRITGGGEEKISDIQSKLAAEQAILEQARGTYLTSEQDLRTNILAAERSMAEQMNLLRTSTDFQETARIQARVNDMQVKLEYMKLQEGNFADEQKKFALGVETARRRAGMSEMEKFLLDMQTKRLEEKKEYDEKLKQKETELNDLKEQTKKEMEIFFRKQQAIKTIQDIMQTTHKRMMEEQTRVTADEVNKQIDFYNRLAAAAKNAFAATSSVGVARFAEGGMVGGIASQSIGTDKIPAMLSAGEVVLNAAQQRNLAGALGSDGGGRNVTINIEQMIGDEQYAEKLGDMIVKNLAYSTAF